MDVVDELVALLEHFAGAEHRAVGLHHLLHLEPQVRGRRSAGGMAEPVQARQRPLGGILRQIGMPVAGGNDLGAAQRRRPPEHHKIDERIGPEPVRAMHGHASRFAQRHQAGHDRIVVAVLLGQGLAVIIRRDAPHVVVDRGEHRDRLPGHVDPRENLRRLGDPGQPLVQHLGIEMIEVQVDVIVLAADAAAFADFYRHGARDHVARGEVLGGRRIALHEALALGVDQIGAFPARPLSDQNAGPVDAGGMELHELHVLERQACAQHHGVAVAGAGVGARAGEVGAAVAAGRQDRLVRLEAVDRAVVEIERDDAATAAVLVHDQIDGEELDEELSRVS